MNILTTMTIVYTGFAAIFLLNRFLAQHLDLDGLGDFRVALSIASIAAALIIFGGQAAVRRFVPQYHADNQWGESKGFIRHYLFLALKLGSAATLLSLGAAGAFMFFGLEHLLHETLLAIIITPLIGISLFVGASIQSMRRPIAAILPHEVLKPVLFWLGCLAWLHFFSTFNEYQAIGILFVVSCIQVAVQFYLLKGALPYRWAEVEPVYDKKNWHGVSLPLLYSGLANAFLVRIDILALEFLHAGEHAVGVFTLLIFVASLVWLNFSTISNLISPKIAELDDDLAGRQKLYNNALVFVIAANLVIGGFILAFANPILAWFHSDMPMFRPWLFVVVIGAMVNCTLELASPFIRFGGHQQKAAKLASRILIANLIVTPAAILHYGMEGAILSLVGMRFIRGIAYMVILRRDVGIKALSVV